MASADTAGARSAINRLARTSVRAWGAVVCMLAMGIHPFNLEMSLVVFPNGWAARKEIRKGNRLGPVRHLRCLCLKIDKRRASAAQSLNFTISCASLRGWLGEPSGCTILLCSVCPLRSRSVVVPAIRSPSAGAAASSDSDAVAARASTRGSDNAAGVNDSSVIAPLKRPGVDHLSGVQSGEPACRCGRAKRVQQRWRIPAPVFRTCPYCSILPMNYWADERRAGCAPMRAWTHYEQIEPDQPGTPCRVHTVANREDLAALQHDVRQARRQADVVVVSIHCEFISSRP
jgi:hypothetical protein